MEETNLGLDDVLEQIENPEATPAPETPPETPPEVNPEETVNTDPDPDKDKEVNPPEVKPGDPGADTPNDSTVIKNMRASYRTEKQKADAMSAIVSKAAAAAGLTVEAYTAKLEADAIAAEAKDRGLNPDIVKQLKEQEAIINKMQESQKRDIFIKNIGVLETKQGLDETQLKDFVTQAGEAGFDLGNPNTSFEAIYFALNHESFEKTTREDERQKVYAEIEAQKNKAPGTIKTGGSGDGGKGNLNDFLKNVKL